MHEVDSLFSRIVQSFWVIPFVSEGPRKDTQIDVRATRLAAQSRGGGESQILENVGELSCPGFPAVG